MAIYFWIALPIEDFWAASSTLMQKYNVTAYLDIKSTVNGITTTKYIPYDANNSSAFIKYFFMPDYYGFFFTSYPLSDVQDIQKSSGHFYSEGISAYTIEGRGGFETERTREQIQLRQILKSPDKSIVSFYSALQRKLKKTPQLQMEKKGIVNLYYVQSEKIIIPPHPHSNKVIGLWEDYYLEHVNRKQVIRPKPNR